MVWSTPPTWTIGQMVTSTQLNILSQDLNETAAAKATSSGRYFAATGANTLAERIPISGYIGTTETTTNGSYVNLTTAGADAIAVSGNRGIVAWTSGMMNSTANAECYVSIACSNATTFAGDDTFSLRHTSATVNAQLMASYVYLFTLTAGTNEMRMRYRVSSGTGSFYDRRISFVPF